MSASKRTQAKDGRLFELTLKPERGYWNDGQPDTSPDGRVGPYLASGQGTAEGTTLRGTVTWDLFEDQEDDSLHPSDMAGVIATADGAKISFQTIGIFVARNEEKTRWHQTAAMRFRTVDERYARLNTVLATMEGTFDYDTRTHHYKVTAAGGSK